MLADNLVPLFNMSQSQLPYRPNVCLLIINNEKLLFLGERLSERNVWQFPQGGVEEGASIEDNVLREASEELGANLNLFQVIKQFNATNQYDFANPPNYAKGKYRGQKQSFWLVKFLGSNLDIKLDRHHPEFSNYRWVTVEQVIKLAESKRLPGYKLALKEFELWLKDQ